MKLLILGHSYVRDLERNFVWQPYREVIVDESVVRLRVHFQAYPGKDIPYFLEHPETFDRIASVKPDIIVVILGGNSIVSDLSNQQLRDNLFEFYDCLNSVLTPGCLRLAMQVEPRRPIAGNRFRAPEYREFNRRRNIVNAYMNRELKRAHMLDRVVLLGGANYLDDDEQFAADGVHLSEEGRVDYKIALMNGVTYALNNRQ